jgi:hypothetical protein
LASYLVDLIIDWSGDERFPYIDDPSVKADVLQRSRGLAMRISGVTVQLRPLQIALRYALRSAKITMQKPPVRKVYVTLSRDPAPKLEATRHFVKCGRQLDPMLLLDIPDDPAALGEFAIECWESAFPVLEQETDFPVAFIRSQFDKFRKQGYAVGGTLKPRLIGGSKAKARIHGKVSGARTELWVEVTHRGEILFERKIWDTPQYAFDVAYYQRDVVIQDGHLIIRAAPLNLVPEARFPLDSLPAEFLKTLT